MASLSPASFCKFWFFSSLLVIFMASFSESAYQFRVGGQRGWIKPTGNETETYNQWATRNRFHIGDSIYFKYKNDSVLVVDAGDYLRCNVSDPNFKFKDGNTVFKFDRYGYFYFISGQPGHCKSGQKLIVRVMSQSDTESPESAPAPGSGDDGQSGQGGQGSGPSGQGDGQGSDSTAPAKPPTPNSTVKLAVAPTTFVLGSITVIFWLFF